MLSIMKNAVPKQLWNCVDIPMPLCSSKEVSTPDFMQELEKQYETSGAESVQVAEDISEDTDLKKSASSNSSIN